MAQEIQFIFYNLPEGEGSVQAIVQDDSVWLTQKRMAQLFDVSVPAINQHLKNIYETGELMPEATIKKNLIVQQEVFRHEYKKTGLLSIMFSFKDK